MINTKHVAIGVIAGVIFTSAAAVTYIQLTKNQHKLVEDGYKQKQQHLQEELMQKDQNLTKLRSAVQYNCENSSGTYDNDQCHCPDALGKDAYDQQTGRCLNPKDKDDANQQHMTIPQGWSVFTATDGVVAFALPPEHIASDTIISEPNGAGDYFPVTSWKTIQADTPTQAVQAYLDRDEQTLVAEQYEEYPHIFHAYYTYTGSEPSIEGQTLTAHIYIVSNQDTHVIFPGWELFDLSGWKYTQEFLTSVVITK